MKCLLYLSVIGERGNSRACPEMGNPANRGRHLLKTERSRGRAQIDAPPRKVTRRKADRVSRSDADHSRGGEDVFKRGGIGRSTDIESR